MPNAPLTVVELPLFLRLAKGIWDDGEREAFVDFIARNPEAGDVIPATSGVRKVRWQRQGSGKRGGTRVIYFYHDARMPLFLILVYSKARQADMTPEQKKQVAALAVELRRDYRQKG
jgi:mRNA-degrading endonuclease RelE of RelBE toxin-antitoxin system